MDHWRFLFIIGLAVLSQNHSLHEAIEKKKQFLFDLQNMHYYFLGLERKMTAFLLVTMML
jgi:hypothetical protein